jgi:dTDP-4-dehydrorhamnose reductase
VYSGSSVAGPHRETECLRPDNVYGRQKLQAEQRCLEILPNTVCLRLSWLYARESFPGEHGHFLATLKAALKDESSPLNWPVYDCRGITDAEDVIKKLPDALNLPGGVWNYGAKADGNTYAMVRTLLEETGMDAALRRLRPNEEAFADNPRDISMDPGKLEAAGIAFPSTREGLRLALEDWIRKENP